MKQDKPVNVWRMVAQRRVLTGRAPLAALPRLAGLLVDTQGEVEFSLSFGGDALCPAFAHLEASTVLPLQCQRSLRRFGFPVALEQRLGLIRSEAGEAALPPGVEPVLVPEDGLMQPLDLVQDELILAVPVLPVAADSTPLDTVWITPEPDAPAQVEHPFAVLAHLKRHS